VLDVDVAVGGRHGRDEAFDVGHGASSSCGSVAS
jgi:hypothetical protein